MVQRLAACIGLAVVLLAGCGGPSAPPSTSGPTLHATEQTGVIRGVVVDQGIRPLPAANVTLRGAPARYAMTAADGSFGFDKVVPGTQFLDARKAGYAMVTSSVEVAAGVDNPRTATIALTFDAGLVPFVETLVFDGFVECSFQIPFQGYLAACAAGPVANNLLCYNYQVCAGNVTNDRVYAYEVLGGVPTFLQSELFWESTQSLGDELQLYVNYGNLDEFNNGGYQGTFNVTTGISPIYVTVNATDIKAAELGTKNQLVPEVLAGPYPATEGTCLPNPAGDPLCGGPGASLEQRFTLYSHAFYNYVPPPGWRFSSAGTVPPPT